MSVWLLLTPLLPLTLAGLIFAMQGQPRFTVWAVRLAPLTLLPALVAGLLPAGTDFALDAVLLGMRLGLDATGRVFLLFSALIWLSATVYAQTWLAGDPRRVRFFGFLLAAAAGNLGLCLAQDVLSFYWLFALMTFSAWALVLHRATPAARHAGTVYVVLAVLGETALLLALLPIVAGGGMLIADVPAIVAASPWRDEIMALLLIGFGVKTGVLGLHVVLPLAYAATPVPGAAVLASAMIKAGLLGWLRFLPLGHALPDWGTLFIVLGLAAAFYGVVVGLAQREPKVILAYSSISQMGLITAGVGLGLMTAVSGAVALSAVTLYALHHALAKAALFLGEGLVRVTRGQARRRVLAALALPALAIAGAPLTSGALAKHQFKELLPPAPWPEALSLLLIVTSIGTTLLMVRLLWRIRQAQPAQTDTCRLPLRLPWYGALAAVLVGAWLLPDAHRGAFATDTLVGAAVPVLIGVVLASIGGALLRGRQVGLPPGDILLPLEALGAALWRGVLSAGRLSAAAWRCLANPAHTGYTSLRALLPGARAEAWLRSGHGIGTASLGLVLSLVLLLALV